MIASIDVIYNQETKSYDLGMPQMINKVETTYSTCYPEPDEEFINSLIQNLMDFICTFFPQFGFCV